MSAPLQRAIALIARLAPYAEDEGRQYEDDGANEPLDTARDAREFLAECGITEALAAAPQPSAPSASEADMVPRSALLLAWEKKKRLEAWITEQGKKAQALGYPSISAMLAMLNERRECAPEAGKIDEAMVERAAKALFEFKYRSWAVATDTDRAYYRDMARAALEAAGLAGGQVTPVLNVLVPRSAVEFVLSDDADPPDNIPETRAMRRDARAALRSALAGAAHPESAARQEAATDVDETAIEQAFADIRRVSANCAVDDSEGDAVDLLDAEEVLRAALASRSSRAPSLTLEAFRAANVARCVKWHPQGIASWSPSDWLTAVTGELGELASLLKMRNRERDGLPGNKFSPSDKQIADELADVYTYLDLLAAALGVDLGRAVVSKFNEVSERVGFPDRIAVTARA